MKSLILVSMLAITAVSLTAQTAQIDSRVEQLWQQASQMPSVQAFPLLLEAARMGHPRAQSTLGNIYFNGIPTIPKDYRQAAYWYTLAAAQGHRSAQYNLAGMYTNGQGGLSIDLPRAAVLLDAGARQNFAPAQEALGTCYEFGEGVARNRQTAIYWLDRAAAQGSATAAQIGATLRNPNTPHFSSEAQLGQYMNAQRQGGNQSGSGRGTCPFYEQHIDPITGIHSQRFVALVPCRR
jgi:TPR repeat protein